MADNNEAFVMLQLLEAEDEDEDQDTYQHIAAASGALLNHGVEESCRLRAERRHQRRLYLTRAQLLPNPRSATPWQVLYDSRNDRAFITTMGFDVAMFHSILVNGFEDSWNNTPIPRSDVASTAAPVLSRRSLDASGALGLILHYLSSTMLDVSLMQIFALIPTTVSRYIDFTLTILLGTLRKMHDARVSWLAGDEFQENNALITVRHPLLMGAFGSMDGLNLPVQTSSDVEIKNATYNGWLSEHFVSCVFVYGGTGNYVPLIHSRNTDLNL